MLRNGLGIPKNTCACTLHSRHKNKGFAGGITVKNLPASAGDIRDVGSIRGLGSSPGGGHNIPLQYSCLENPMDRGAWQAVVHKVAELNTTKHSCTHTYKTSICVLTSELQERKNTWKLPLLSF